jgi:hypothetical protein
MLQKLTKAFALLALSNFQSYFRKNHPEKNEVEIDNLRKESVDTQAEIIPNV